MFISPITRWSDLRVEARIATVLGGAVVALAVITLLGWWASIPALVELTSTTAPLLGNTALCLGLAGAAVIALAFGWARLARLLAAVVMAVGALTFGEYLFNADLGLDEILFPSFSRLGAGGTGRMSPIAAHCLVQIGLALFLVSFNPPCLARLMIAALLGSIAAGVSGMVLLGYIFNLPDTYGWNQSTSVSPQGAVGLVLLGCSVVGLAWWNPAESERRSPRWLAGAVAFAGVGATLILWQALHSSQREQIHQAVAENAREAGDQVTIRMEARINAFARMARRWDFLGRPSEAAWEDDAKAYVHDFPDIKALEWIDAQQRVQWVEPQTGAEPTLADDALREDRQLDAAEIARRTRTSVLTRCAPLPGGGVSASSSTRRSTWGTSSTAGLPPTSTSSGCSIATWPRLRRATPWSSRRMAPFSIRATWPRDLPARGWSRCRSICRACPGGSAPGRPRACCGRRPRPCLS